jgi:hypothetical protein
MRIERIDNPPADEDFAEHQRTFAFFLRLAAIAVLHIAACLIAVAVGGLYGHWYLALFIFVIASIAAAMGVASENLAWKPGMAALAVSLLTFAVTA